MKTANLCLCMARDTKWPEYDNIKQKSSNVHLVTLTSKLKWCVASDRSSKFMRCVDCGLRSKL